MIVSQTSPVVTHPQEQITNYLVVSYCWQSNDWSGAYGKAKVDPWPFSRSMAQAILDMRLSESEGVWLDQSCINQDDEQEKSVAVASMDML